MSLIANQYQYKELLNFGFKVLQSQFSRAKNLKNNMAESNNNNNSDNNIDFNNHDQQSFFQDINTVTIKRTKIIQFLLANLEPSSVWRATSALKQTEYYTADYDPYAIYYLEFTLTDLYYEFIALNPQEDISKSSYFSYIPKNFKPAKRKTDMCKIYLSYD